MLGGKVESVARCDVSLRGDNGGFPREASKVEDPVETLEQCMKTSATIYLSGSSDIDLASSAQISTAEMTESLTAVRTPCLIHPTTANAEPIITHADRTSLHTESSLCSEHRKNRVGSYSQTNYLITQPPRYHCPSPPPLSSSSVNTGDTISGAAIQSSSKSAEFYRLGRGVGYTRPEDESFGWRKLRRRMRRDAAEWLRVISSWRFKAPDAFSDLRSRNQAIEIYVHVNESMHTVDSIPV